MNSISILFWSGGKDSLLSLRVFEESASDIALLTTYDEAENIVPVQNIPLRLIREQALHLECMHIAIPLPFPCSNDIYLDRIGSHLEKLPFQIDHLVFGDWHLEDIKKWREDVFCKMGYRCLFPLWQKEEGELLELLFRENCRIVISSVDDNYLDIIQPGDEFNRAFVKDLPDHIDPLGENGEFHTRVIFD